MSYNILNTCFIKITPDLHKKHELEDGIYVEIGYENRHTHKHTHMYMYVYMSMNILCILPYAMYALYNLFL